MNASLGIRHLSSILACRWLPGTFGDLKAAGCTTVKMMAVGWHSPGTATYLCVL